LPEDDAWDWKVLYYVGTVILQKSEIEFWNMSPRTLKALTDVHIKLNSGRENPEMGVGGVQKGFIDQVL
jgi:hypothetical protein